MMRNLMLTLAYDGADFHGWQNQPDLRTVQGCLETALRRTLRHQVAVIGCSRTDAGVHALAYVANVWTTSPVSDWNIFRSIGSRLPKDMSLLKLETVPLTFHATRSAISKLYRYRIHNVIGRPVEQLSQRYVYHFWQPLDIDAMRQAAAYLVGRHDFTSFASAGNDRESNVRTVLRIDIAQQGPEIHFDVEGEGFLYKQVRNMIGTLVEVGRGHWTSQRIIEILAAKSRQAAGPTAPARGLCLHWLKYDLENLPAPSAEQLARAAQSEPPAGRMKSTVDKQHRSTAPVPPDLDPTEAPAA
jgi:tRNA pseudouridine38-40 synthase